VDDDTRWFQSVLIPFSRDIAAGIGFNGASDPSRPHLSPAGVLLMLPADKNLSCPECETGMPIGRRDFIRVLGTTAAVAAVGGLTPLQKARAARAEKQAEAEAMVFELFKSMDGDQKKKVVRAWDFSANNGKGLPARLLTHNGSDGKSKIG